MSILNGQPIHHNRPAARPDEIPSLAGGWDCPESADMSAPKDEFVAAIDGMDDSVSWTTTQGWFALEAERYDAMGSELGTFMGHRVREIARQFEAMDADTPSVFEARAETYGK